MTYILFIDDERDYDYVVYDNYRYKIGLPEFSKSQQDIIYSDTPVRIARTYQHAVSIIEQFGTPDLIFFDHDLGFESLATGYDFAKDLIERDLDGKINLNQIEYYIHSANPIGRENIRKALESYLNFKKDSLC